MRILVRHSWIETEPTYRFSDEFCDLLARELKTRVRPSKLFLQKYPKYALMLLIKAETGTAKARIAGVHDYGKPTLLEYQVALPHKGGRRPDWPSDYPQAFEQLFAGVVQVFRKLEMDTTRIVQDVPELIKTFLAMPKATIISNWLDRDEMPMRVATPKVRLAPRQRPLKKTPPKWRTPKQLKKLVESDGMWESERWDPILLTVMSDTSYNGVDIPLAWQIEFDPYDERFAAASGQLKAMDIEPDGDGWAEVIEKKFAKRHPTLARKLHSDSESSTCVLWVESENACQKLVEVVWSLIHRI